MTYGHHHTLSYRAAFTIAPAQITEVFHQRPPLAPPSFNWLDNLALWQKISIAFIILALLAGGALYVRARFIAPKRRA